MCNTSKARVCKAPISTRGVGGRFVSVKQGIKTLASGRITSGDQTKLYSTRNAHLCLYPAEENGIGHGFYWRQRFGHGPTLLGTLLGCYMPGYEQQRRLHKGPQHK